MSPSTPDSPKPRIPFQPNPFGSSALGSPWASDIADVPSINEKPFRTVVDALRQMRAGAGGTSIVLIGEPGSGKTHLLGRLRNRLQQDRREGKGSVVYVYVRCNASAGTLWRHLRHALASDLLKVTDGSQLHEVFQTDPTRLEKVDHRGLRRVLECLRDGRHFHTASAWLRGEVLGDADLAALGLAVEKDEEDLNREREARLIVNAVLNFLAPIPIVLCFDQIEALETYRGEEAGYHAMGQLISALTDAHSHLLLISCIVAAFEDRIDRLANGADRDRWVKYKDLVRQIDWDQAAALVKARLDTALPLRAARAAHADDAFWPLDASSLQPLFGETGFCLARTLIRACERQFAQLLDAEEQLHPAQTRGEFLQSEYNRNVAKTRRHVARQGIGKTLADCLPWLLENSGLTPLGQDAARSKYSQQAWRGPSGDTALAFCEGRGVALTNQLKRIERQWTSKNVKLALLRDASVQPGAAGAAALRQLKERGAREVNPLPEALVALQAIRNMIAIARSGELFFGADNIVEREVNAWALDHLPAEVRQLRDALIETQPPEPDEDSVLPVLLPFIADRKIADIGAAAKELELTEREVTDCARRNPMRFGLLDGPPPLIFEAVFETAR